MTRVLTALVLIPTVLYVIFGGPPWLFKLVVCFFGVACFEEYAGIVRAHGIPIPRRSGHAMGLAFLLIPQADWRVLVAFAVLAMARALWRVEVSRALPQASAQVLGLLYVYGAWRCAMHLRDLSPWWLFFATGLNWVGDTAALIVGRSFGRHKLAPVISPKKSWEGAIGSVAACVLFGSFLLTRQLPHVPMSSAVLLSAGACIAGQVGDLAESVLKRGAGMKDSGTMLPGHGGWLDRLDSTLFTLPFVSLLAS